MKRNRYNVKVKLIFETEMDHSQVSAEKAIEDVERVINGYLDSNNNLDITMLFDNPPRKIYKVRKVIDNGRN